MSEEEYDAAFKNGFQAAVKHILEMVEYRMQHYEKVKKIDAALACDLIIYDIKDRCLEGYSDEGVDSVSDSLST